jgi:hypothetical protein
MINKKNRLSEEIKKGVLYLNIGLLLIICIIGTVYLISVGSSAQMGYSISLKQLELTELRTKNENLRHQLLQVSSLSDLQTDSNKISSMERAEIEFYETRLNRLSKK